MSTLRLTAAQAAVRYLAAQWVETERGRERYFAGVWAIFGHGNVAGLGEALYAARGELPTWRAHNEQAMAHAAIAYAKQLRRRRAMICTTSIGPGATNLVTAAALAHVNRLPVLFLPGDVFASGRPDPVLQQIEVEGDATVTANDCFRPVSRRFDRITRPEQLLEALPAAMEILFDPARCGPVTLAFCQDAQCEAFDYPRAFFEPRTRTFAAVPPADADLDHLEDLLRRARAPLFIAGGGVRYAGAEAVLDRFLRAHDLPVAETQAGKGALAWDHPCNLGGLGVTGTAAANAAAREADLIVGLGTRLQDFTTGSRALFESATHTPQLVQVNTSAFDAGKHGARAIVGDVAATLSALDARLGTWLAPPEWSRRRVEEQAAWNLAREAVTAPAIGAAGLPSDAQVIGVVNRCAPEQVVVVCAAGGLPGELHKLWRVRATGGYHVEYGYSCMGYEIAGGLGVKMAEPGREVVVMVGDGSYLMMNSEIATSVMLGVKLVIVVLDNRGYGCINRLQRATGGAPFNNLLADCTHVTLPAIDFAAHAASLGAEARKAGTLAELETALSEAWAGERTQVVVIDTDPAASTAAGGAWWDVAVPMVSPRAEVKAARTRYDEQLAALRKEGQ